MEHKEGNLLHGFRTRGLYKKAGFAFGRSQVRIFILPEVITLQQPLEAREQIFERGFDLGCDARHTVDQKRVQLDGNPVAVARARQRRSGRARAKELIGEEGQESPS